MTGFKTVAHTGLWSAVLHWSRFGLNAAVFLILARLLELPDIGAFAVAMAPVTFLQVVQRAVFPDTVVQEGEPSEDALSTLFWLSLGVGVISAAAMLGGSYLMGAWTGDPRAGTYMRALSLCPLILALSAVQEGVLKKELRIRLLAIRTSVSVTIAGALAVAAGLAGAGGWALTAFTFANVAISSTFVLAVCKWRPSLRLDTSYARRIAPTLWALTGSYSVSAAVFPLLQFLISGGLGVAAGGAFQISQRFLALLDALAAAPARYIALPLFSKLHNDDARFGAGLTAAVTVGSLVVSPLYLGLAAVSPSLLPIVLGDTNAAPCIPVLQAFCLYGPPGLVTGLVSQALTSRGLSGIAFRRSIIMLAVAVLPCVVATRYSVLHVSTTYALFGGYAGLAISLGLAHRYCAVSVGSLLFAVVKPLLSAGLMAACLVAVDQALLQHLSSWTRLAALIAIGVATYPSFVILLLGPEAMRHFGGIDVRRVILGKRHSSTQS